MENFFVMNNLQNC